MTDDTPTQSPLTLMDVRAAAEFLNVSPRTLYALVTDNRVPHARVGGQIRFVPDMLDKWVRDGGEHD